LRIGEHAVLGTALVSLLVILHHVNVFLYVSVISDIEGCLGETERSKVTPTIVDDSNIGKPYSTSGVY
jgi:thioester reductase-like protein